MALVGQARAGVIKALMGLWAWTGPGQKVEVFFAARLAELYVHIAGNWHRRRFRV